MEPLRPTSPPGAITIGVTQLHRNWVNPLIGLALFGFGVWLHGPASPLGNPPVPGLFLAWIGGVFGLASYFRNTSPRAVPVVLEVRPGELVLGEEAPIPADAIAEAKTLAGEMELPELLLTLRDGSQRWLRLKPHDADTVRRELGIGVGERRASFPLQIPFRTRWLATLFALEGFVLLRMLHHSHHLDVSFRGWLDVAPSLLIPTPLLAWLIGSILRGKAVVGADGFTTRWAFFSRFIPFREVTGLRTIEPWTNSFSREIIVSLRDRRLPLRLSARDIPKSEADRGAEARALLDHLSRGLERSRTASADPAADLAPLVAHRPQNSAEWLASLDALVQGNEARYRVAAPITERLADIARDASAPSEARIGAAAALLRRGDGEGRTSVRVATDACADPVLRDTLLALEQAQDDAAFTAALRRAHLARR